MRGYDLDDTSPSAQTAVAADGGFELPLAVQLGHAIRIEIDKGAYVPRFERCEKAEPPPPAPSVASGREPSVSPVVEVGMARRWRRVAAVLVAAILLASGSAYLG